MRIFFSHSGRDKPLLREIRRYLPGYLSIWIDEFEIPIGGNLTKTIKKAIQTSNDLIVFFFGPEAVKSPWVLKELRWAYKQENITQRNFIIPVVLNEGSWKELPKQFQERKYLVCNDFTEIGIKTFAQRLHSEIYNILLSLIYNSPRNTSTLSALQVQQIASKISDNQLIASQESRLTREKLEAIVDSIPPHCKIFLLLIYELVKGKFSSAASSERFERYDILSVELHTEQFGKWIQAIDRSKYSTETQKIRDEYGLGDKDYTIRTVFLNGLETLAETERINLFRGVEITSVERIR